MIGIYKRVIYREQFEISPIEKFIAKLFALRQKYKEERNDCMQTLAKLIMNSLFRVQIQKETNGSYESKSQYWMELKCDDFVLDYWKLQN